MAQHFTGIKGSLYSPVFNTYSQPSSGVGMPYNWAVPVGGVNAFWDNNIAKISPAKVDWKADTIYLDPYFYTGKRAHYLNAHADIHLLNFLFRVPKHEKWVVGFGWNLHSYISSSKLEYNYQDSMSSASSFLKANVWNNKGEGRIINQQWSEWFINVSTLLKEDRYTKVEAGASLKLLRGLGAGVADLEKLIVTQPKSGNRNDYISQLSARFGYSKNFDDFDDNLQPKGVWHTLQKGSPLSVGLDVGLTIMRKRLIYLPSLTNDDPSDYLWKVNLAITDFGRLKYPLGEESIVLNTPKGGITLKQIDNIQRNAPDFDGVLDSIRNLIYDDPWEGTFSVSLPTALRVNFDKNLGRHFYVNSDLVLDASFLNRGVDYRLRTLSALTVTPRWEIKRLGVYAPLYLNVHGSFLAGAAIRLGPLTAGLHGFGWLFHHTRSGGAYVGLVIKGFKKKKDECPSF